MVREVEKMFVGTRGRRKMKGFVGRGGREDICRTRGRRKMKGFVGQGGREDICRTRGRRKMKMFVGQGGREDVCRTRGRRKMKMFVGQGGREDVSRTRGRRTCTSSPAPPTVISLTNVGQFFAALLWIQAEVAVCGIARWRGERRR